MPDSTPTTNAVIVEPVPANKSKTLLWSKAAFVVGVIAGIIPEMIELLANPAVVAAMNEFVSEDVRRRFFAILLPALAAVFHALRKQTAGPIAGTPLEQELAQQTEASLSK